MEFQEINDAYVQQREQERKNLIAYLQKHTLFSHSGLQIVTRRRSGMGAEQYSSGGHIAPFDLRNWKWVECKSADENFNAVISLNMPETDLSSGNAHSLYDRIGLIVTYTRRNNYYKTSIWTDIDLPLDEHSLEKIAGLIVEQYGIYNWINH